jgi:hypothetical protein
MGQCLSSLKTPVDLRFAACGSLSQFSVDGQPVKGAVNRRFSGAALAGKILTIANAGESAAQLVTTVSMPSPATGSCGSVGLCRTITRSRLPFHSLASSEKSRATLRCAERGFAWNGETYICRGGCS